MKSDATLSPFGRITRVLISVAAIGAVLSQIPFDAEWLFGLMVSAVYCAITAIIGIDPLYAFVGPQPYTRPTADYDAILGQPVARIDTDIGLVSKHRRAA